MNVKYIKIIIALFLFLVFSCNKEEIENERLLLEAYLEENGLSDEEPTSSGLYCIKSGFSTPVTLTADLPVSGDSIFTVYKGYLLSDETIIFDEKDFDNPGEYLYLIDQVIEGWEEAIGLLKKDMSALLIIPSDLAYKGDQVGVIPPYSTLIFEVRIIDVR